MLVHGWGSMLSLHAEQLHEFIASKASNALARLTPEHESWLLTRHTLTLGTADVPMLRSSRVRSQRRSVLVACT